MLQAQLDPGLKQMHLEYLTILAPRYPVWALFSGRLSFMMGKLDTIGPRLISYQTACPGGGEILFFIAQPGTGSHWTIRPISKPITGTTELEYTCWWGLPYFTTWTDVGNEESHPGKAYSHDPQAVSGRRGKDNGQAKITVAHHRAQCICWYTMGTELNPIPPLSHALPRPLRSPFPS